MDDDDSNGLALRGLSPDILLSSLSSAFAKNRSYSTSRNFYAVNPRSYVATMVAIARSLCARPRDLDWINKIRRESLT